MLSDAVVVSIETRKLAIDLMAPEGDSGFVLEPVADDELE